MKLYLEKPIFVYYVNYEHSTIEYADRQLNLLRDCLDKINDVNFLIVPCNFTKIECVWNGAISGMNIDQNIQNLIYTINDRIDILSEMYSDHASIIRELKLSNLIGEE